MAIATGVVALAAAAEDLARADADSMRDTIARIDAAAARPRAAGAPPVRTSFTAREANAYLHYYGPTFLPAGVAKPQVTIGNAGRVGARAIVDLDAVRLSHNRGLLDPLAFVTGTLEVVASGTVAGADGRGIVRFEGATVGGISVPQSVAQELLRFYTRTPDRPRGFEFDQPFDLPAGLRSVAVDQGRVQLVQ